jgi:hypothetical protein
MARGIAAQRLGHFRSARVDLEKSIALYSEPSHRRMAFTFAYGIDPKVAALSWLAPALWALGYPDQALTCCAEVEAAARRISHPFSQCFGPQAFNFCTTFVVNQRLWRSMPMRSSRLRRVRGLPFGVQLAPAFVPTRFSNKARREVKSSRGCRQQSNRCEGAVPWSQL